MSWSGGGHERDLSPGLMPRIQQCVSWFVFATA
jgi:hypothetical protein